ncbi:ParB N-terminal domain-containing protein [Nocardia stercoris]|uniref:ParB-like N-terminal domain-containing protein n=1 Tax=Nocardia stercoris TaxID=2483361 RepID=A0A3M2L0F1_9NOCA|nr:ParB N-terminal domain-containing protein [Nocardia stercoris]RMI30416.1 hypothetical protein EBN03_22555 [Nocardia stercoris]
MELRGFRPRSPHSCESTAASAAIRPQRVECVQRLRYGRRQSQCNVGRCRPTAEGGHLHHDGQTLTSVPHAGNDVSVYAPGSIDSLPSVRLSISEIDSVDYVRLGGVSQPHVRHLAELDVELPPIVVHSSTMRVIDGVHRIRAAVLRGDTSIEARLFTGSEEECFLLAVYLNSSHGLPLSRSDRTAAAIRLVRTQPEWSNRVIAGVVGLAPGTVGKLRQAAGQIGQSTKRLGRDGRLRPVDGMAARERVVELLARTPTASARSIAREVGISHSTVQEIRRRMERGEGDRAPGNPALEPGKSSGYTFVENRKNSAELLRKLINDPSVRSSESGRQLIRWLHNGNVVGEWHTHQNSVPGQWIGAVAELARTFATEWNAFADTLDGVPPTGGPDHRADPLLALVSTPAER